MRVSESESRCIIYWQFVSRLRLRCDIWLTAQWQAGGHFIWRQIRRREGRWGSGGGEWRLRTEEDGSVGATRTEKNHAVLAAPPAGNSQISVGSRLKDEQHCFLAFEEIETLFWAINSSALQCFFVQKFKYKSIIKFFFRLLWTYPGLLLNRSWWRQNSSLIMCPEEKYSIIKIFKVRWQNLKKCKNSKAKIRKNLRVIKLRKPTL